MSVQEQTPAPPETQPAPARRGKPKPPRPDHCLNCGHAADGKFCAECGQENKDHTVALRPLLEDLLAEMASWDSRLARTVASLLFRPGFLTNEYNAGRRVRYLSPFKLYLTVSVVFFLILPWKANTKDIVVVDPRPHTTHLGIVISGDDQSIARTVPEYDAQQKKLPPAKRDTAFERVVTRGAIRATQSPAGFAQTLFGDISKMMFFLLPLFALTLKLLYLRTRRLYVEHLVFLLHIHAFAFLVLTPLLFAHPGWLVVAVFLALTAYVIAALRTVYRQGWPKTLTKFVLLVFGYVFLLSLCFTGTALVALWLL